MLQTEQQKRIDALFTKAMLGKSPLDWTIYEEIEDLTDEVESIYQKHLFKLRLDIHPLKIPYTRLRERLEVEERNRVITWALEAPFIQDKGFPTIQLLWEVSLLLYRKLHAPASWFREELGVYGMADYTLCNEKRLRHVLYVLLEVKNYQFSNILELYKTLILEDAR